MTQTDPSAQNTPPSRHALRVADLLQRRETAFDLTPDGAELAALRDLLGLTDLRKLSFTGALMPVDKQDWQLEGRLGATVVQPCVATLEPVTTRIETEVARLFTTDFEEPDAVETEMPEDDRTEPLGSHIDLWQIAGEALSLALPLYPRAPNAQAPVEIRVTEPGAAPMSDDEAKPFAGLAALKAQLTAKDEDD